MLVLRKLLRLRNKSLNRYDKQIGGNVSNQLPANLPADPGIQSADATSGDLPVKTDENFIAEFEVMDLSKLKGKSFMVAVSRDARSKGKFICTTAHGPYDFYEMCEEVGVMWREHQHHAKVYVLQKDRKARAQYLDENTTDYIEAHYVDLITEGLLDGVFEEQKQFTCQANVVEDDGEENPLKDKVEPSSPEDEEEEDAS